MSQRLFCSGHDRCKNGCIYCFSDWSEGQYFGELSAAQAGDVSVVYPICDSEVLYQTEDFFARLCDYAERAAHPVVFSISTKCPWTAEQLNRIAAFNRNYASVIKLAVSFSAMEHLPETEPHALPLEGRLALLSELNARGIPTNILLKPLLPFIDAAEYRRLIFRCAEICRRFVAGDLYVSPGTPFFDTYIGGRYPLLKKYSTWMQKEVTYVRHPDYESILAAVGEAGGQVWESDLAMIRDSGPVPFAGDPSGERDEKATEKGRTDT